MNFSVNLRMKIHLLFLGFLIFSELFLIIIFAVPDEDVYYMLSDPKVVFTLEPSSEIQNHCSKFLSSASELTLDVNTRFRLQSDLSFQNGDWKQEIDGAPLIPFHDSENSIGNPFKLVSFEVKEVGSVQHFQNSISIGGLVLIGISRETSFVHHFNSAPNGIRPGSSFFTFSFQGIYTETAEERRLCLLGNSTITSGILLEEDLSDFPKGFLEKDKILFVLHYPQAFSLTRGAIRGELTSLYERTNPKFFDPVYISSQLHAQSRYEYNSKLLESITCEPNFQDELMKNGVQKFTSSEFCNIVHTLSGHALSFFPYYKSGGRYLKGSKLGDLLFGKEIEDVGNVKLLLQYVNCDRESANNNGAVMVSAVIRSIPAGMDLNIAQAMTGLSGLTLTAEGLWDSSSGQLCMVGCHERVNSGLEGCNLRISLYFPLTFSIEQRSVVFGSISSIKDGLHSDVHLQLGAVMHPSYLKAAFDWYVCHYLSYNYSKFSLAPAFKRNTQPFQVLTNLKQSLLKYPSLSNGEEPFAQLEQLSEKLLINGYVVRNRLLDGCNSRTSINMEVLSLGPLLGKFCRGNSKKTSITKQSSELSSKDILNVSAHLVVKELNQTTCAYTGKSHNNISELFLEGLYDPLVGEMHLIGCRKIVSAERGLDCSIKVQILYPSHTMQWLMDPTPKITVTSQRNKHDPLYFGSITLHTRLPHYQDPIEIMAHRRMFKRILQIIMLAMAIAVISSQLYYMRKQADIVPLISLVMLAFQILGYSLPLISGSEILFKLNVSELYKARNYSTNRLLPNILDSAGRVLLLVALLLTSRLFQMVLESRSKSNARRPSNKRSIKMVNDKLVLVTTLTICALGFLTWLVFDNHNGKFQLQKDTFKTREIEQAIWMSKFEYFVFTVQDFFLLPQILGNLFWRIHVKSLRKSYYLGFTLLRVLLHLYDYISGPILYFESQELEFVNAIDASSKFSKVAVVITMIVLAAILHIQQNWKDKSLKYSLKSRKFNVLSTNSALYEKLFNKSVED